MKDDVQSHPSLFENLDGGKDQFHLTRIQTFNWGTFPGVLDMRALFLGTAIVLGTGIALAVARSRTALLRQLLVLGAFVCSLALLLPHLTGFEPTGVGGRFFYLPGAFFALAVGLALHETILGLHKHPAWASAVLAVGVVLIVAHAVWGWRAVEQYRIAQLNMREMAEALGKLAARRAPQDFYVVIVPDFLGRVPFGGNAQAGLVLPPVQRQDISSALLVQTLLEVEGLDRKIDSGVLGALRQHSLSGLMEGRASPGASARVEPTRYYCWNAARRALVVLAIDISARTAIAPRVAQAYEAAGCDAGASRI